MKKFFNYIVTSFKIKSVHPEESNTGWEIRWTVLNIAFMKKLNKEENENKRPDTTDNA